MASQGVNNNVFVDMQGFSDVEGSFVLKQIALTEYKGAVNFNVMVASCKPFSAIKCQKPGELQCGYHETIMSYRGTAVA